MTGTATIRPPLTAYLYGRILAAVAAQFQVAPEAITSGRRGNRQVAAGRLAFYALLYELSAASTVDIGRRLGRDHSTIVDGLQRVKTWPQVAPVYHAALMAAQREVTT